MARQSPETALVLKMRKAGRAKYGDRLVDIKYHGDAMSEAGVSDILCCLDGVFVAVEAKSPESSTHKRKTIEASIAHALEKGPTVKQRLFVARVLAAGGCAGFAATVEQFMEVLAHAEYRVYPEAGMCEGHNV
jgi:hypothetical protein